MASSGTSIIAWDLSWGHPCEFLGVSRALRFWLIPKCPLTPLPRFHFLNILLCMWGVCLCRMCVHVHHTYLHTPVHAHTYTERHMHACVFIHIRMSVYACVHIEDELGCLLWSLFILYFEAVFCIWTQSALSFSSLPIHSVSRIPWFVSWGLVFTGRVLCT